MSLETVKPKVHILNTYRILTTKEIRVIMAVLGCDKIVCDKEALTHYLYVKKDNAQ
jgi:hypothetical protein